uniref:Uncharacterized protein n=1 Tax=Timema douglasi TaxID=61478 RepID=A0A7R8VTP0_TIMDO|nr:unnamed protein product [Timema douglasi]
MNRVASGEGRTKSLTMSEVWSDQSFRQAIPQSPIFLFTPLHQHCSLGLWSQESEEILGGVGAMEYTHGEYWDMATAMGASNSQAGPAARLYADHYPNRWHPSINVFRRLKLRCQKTVRMRPA